MAVFSAVDGGWVFDHQQSVNKTYALTQVCSRFYVNHNHESASHDCCIQRQFKINPEMFAIYEEFRMDSQFSKMNHESMEKSKVNNQRKRKRRNLTERETAWIIHHTKIESLIEECLHRVESSQLFSGDLTNKSLIDNNLSARAIAKNSQFVGEVDFEFTSGAVIEPLDLGSTDHLILESPALINRLIICSFTVPTVAMMDDQKILLPANCRFLMSDIRNIQLLIDEGTKYDCIVIDPPWKNKSVKRKKTYNMLNNFDLLRLPVKELSKSNTLIAVWVTNKLNHKEFVENSMFKHWGVRHWTQWHWLKVTKSGKPVCAVRNQKSTKRPYESLLIGRVSQDDVTQDFSLENVIPENAIIVSVPCSIHSKKPPLNEILDQYLPEKSTCLELFARNLLPGWTSWGNEVLMHQHLNMFVESGLPIASASDHGIC